MDGPIEKWTDEQIDLKVDTVYSKNLPISSASSSPFNLDFSSISSSTLSSWSASLPPKLPKDEAVPGVVPPPPTYH